MTSPTVVISGAGIAGPALAFGLARYGYRLGHRGGDEMDAALAVSAVGREEVVRNSEFHCAA